MKNSIVILGITALTAVSIPSTNAGQREWATVGKVLTGVAAVHALSHILPPPPIVITAPAPVFHVPFPPPILLSAPAYCPPPAPVVVYAPSPCPPPRVVAVSHYHSAPYIEVHPGFARRHQHRQHCR